MRIRYIIIILAVLFFYMSCSSESESPGSLCGTPASENYLIGVIDTACVIAESGDDWLNFPGTVSRFDCGQILKSDFVSYSEEVTFSIMLSIPHSVGQNCSPLSPDAIAVGKYDLVRGNNFSGPGEAAFSVKTGKNLYISWDPDLDQTSEAYFEITEVENIPAKPEWSYGTFYKIVKGKINLKVKDTDLEDPVLNIKNLEFSGYFVY